MVTEEDPYWITHGGRLQARLSLARHKRASRAKIQHDSARTRLWDRWKDRAHLKRMRAKRVAGRSSKIDVPLPAAGRRLLIKAGPAHKQRGEQAAAQQGGKGTGIAHALPGMLGRGRGRTLIFMSACDALCPQRPRRA